MSSGIGLKLDNVSISSTETVGVIKREEVLVAEAIHRLLNTYPFERGRERYGCRIKEILFEPNDYTAQTLGAYFINDAIQQFEPRVVVEGIQAIVDRDNNKISYKITFRLKKNPQTLFTTTVTVQ